MIFLALLSEEGYVHREKVEKQCCFERLDEKNSLIHCKKKSITLLHKISVSLAILFL